MALQSQATLHQVLCSLALFDKPLEIHENMSFAPLLYPQMISSGKMSLNNHILFSVAVLCSLHSDCTAVSVACANSNGKTTDCNATNNCLYVAPDTVASTELQDYITRIFNMIQKKEYFPATELIYRTSLAKLGSRLERNRPMCIPLLNKLVEQAPEVGTAYNAIAKVLQRETPTEEELNELSDQYKIITSTIHMIKQQDPKDLKKFKIDESKFARCCILV